MRDYKKVLSPCILGMTKSRNCAIFLNIIFLCLEALFQILFQFAYPFKIEAFVLVPQVLINSIYDAFMAFKIPTIKVSFQIWKQNRSPKRLNLKDTGNEEGPRSCISPSSANNLRGVGWCIILQEQNTSSQLSSTFLHNLLTQLR